MALSALPYCLKRSTQNLAEQHLIVKGHFRTLGQKSRPSAACSG